jgi:hypothetical protein
VKDNAAGAGTVAVDRLGGVAKADGRATSATTRVASRLIAGAAGAVAAVAGWVVFANWEPTAGAAVLGCLRPITAVVPDRGLESAPTVCGVSLVGASGVAALLAGAVEDVEVGSVSADVVAADSDETVEELVCRPPVATTTPGAPERVRPTSPAGAAPAGVEAVGDDVRPPELLRAIWPGAFSGPRRRPRSFDVEEIVAEVSVDDDASDEELALESAGSANATTGVLASAIPTPSATANAPTRPM